MLVRRHNSLHPKAARALEAAKTLMYKQQKPSSTSPHPEAWRQQNTNVQATETLIHKPSSRGMEATETLMYKQQKPSSTSPHSEA